MSPSPSVCMVCRTRLVASVAGRVRTWLCSTCRGRGASVRELKRAVDRERLRSAWSAAWSARDGTGDGRACPSCRAPMHRVAAGQDRQQLPQELQICCACRFAWLEEPVAEAWLDPSAHGRPGSARPSSPAFELVRDAAYAARHLFGLPSGDCDQAPHRTPVVTCGLAAALAAVGAVTLVARPDWIGGLGFVPSDPLRHGGATLLATFFLHASWLHLLGNLYFFLVFGDEVEDDLGRLRFALLLAFATIAGTAAHAAYTSTPDIPLIGASGGISGVLLYYALRFPSASLDSTLWIGLVPLRVRLHAFVYFGLWFALQVLLGTLGVDRFSGVAYSAHVGGALAGIVGWVLLGPCVTDQVHRDA